MRRKTRFELKGNSIFVELFLGPIPMQSDRWIEKGNYPIGDPIEHSLAVEEVPLESQLFRSSNPIRTYTIPSKKSIFSTRHAGRIARTKTFLKPAASLPTPQNTRSHPTTAPMQASLLLCCCCSQRLGVPRPLLRPSTVRTDIQCSKACYRCLFFNTAAAAAAAAMLSLATLDEIQRPNRR